jgi:hypothetical protein
MAELIPTLIGTTVYRDATDRTMSQMDKSEASGWRLHSHPNMVMRGSPVANSGRTWILADILLIYETFDLDAVFCSQN